MIIALRQVSLVFVSIAIIAELLSCGKKISRIEIGGVADGEKSNRVIVSDSFNRANNFTSMGRADTGQLWINGDTAVYGVNNSSAFLNSGSGTAYVTIAETDLIAIQITTSSITGSVALEFRQADSDNLWRFFRLGTSVRLDKITGGASTIVATGAINLINGNKLRVELRGCNIQAFVSVKLFDITDCTHGGGNSYGFRDLVGGSDFDDFLIEEIE